MDLFVVDEQLSVQPGADLELDTDLSAKLDVAIRGFVSGLRRATVIVRDVRARANGADLILTQLSSIVEFSSDQADAGERAHFEVAPDLA